MDWTPLIAAISAAAGAWGAIRVELRYLRRDLDAVRREAKATHDDLSRFRLQWKITQERVNHGR